MALEKKFGLRNTGGLNISKYTMKKTKIVFLSLLAVVAMAFTFKNFTIQKAQEP